MDAKQAARNLEVIRTLMERTCQYQLLTARAGLAAGILAGLGGLTFLWLNPADPTEFGLVWAVVFAGAVLATVLGTVLRGREQGERIWSRQARAVLMALAPSLFAAAAFSIFFFSRGEHLWLPGVWMLCYGQGALATASYSPPPIRWLGAAFLLFGCITLALGTAAAVPMMSIAFGLGHISLGACLLLQERRQLRVRLHRDVA